MKILILANDYKTLANFRMELLERFIAEKYEVVISLPYDEKNVQFRNLGCTVIENNMTRHGTNPIKELQIAKNYIKLIREVKPNVVLTYTIKPNIYGGIACRKCKVPIISNITGIGSTMQKKGLKQFLMFSFMKFGMCKSDVVFFQNEENMKLLTKKGIGGKKSELLPGSGVNLDKHCFVEYPKNNEKTKFIVVSRLRQDKGFDELFGAIEKLSYRQDLEFHIVGWCEENKYQQQIENMVKNFSVIYHGEKTQQEVHELIAQCHCIIHPSYHEGMANVLMEASAAGRPCLASDIWGCKEIIDNGETGYVFKPQSIDAIVEVVEKFTNLSLEQQKVMGEKARKKMENEYDREIVIKTYISNINKLVKGKEYVTLSKN